MSITIDFIYDAFFLPIDIQKEDQVREKYYKKYRSKNIDYVLSFPYWDGRFLKVEEYTESLFNRWMNHPTIEPPTPDFTGVLLVLVHQWHYTSRDEDFVRDKASSISHNLQVISKAGQAYLCPKRNTGA